MASLGEALDELRRQRFAGRGAEIALFEEALDAPGVIFVHGPGGVGKSTLLDMFAHLAARRGRDPVRVDARHLALGSDALPTVAGDGRPILLIDTYELLEPVDDWVRDKYLPSLPRNCLAVIAGRHAPSPRWRADPAWRELMRVVALGNLPPEDGRAWLTAQDVPAESHDRLLAISRGHPLTLSMLIDAVSRGATPRTLGDLPDVLGALIVQMVDEPPSPRHRTALEVCAHVPVTTEDLLRSIIGGDVGELFAWLRGRPFIEESPHGLYPHDVVRDILDADLRWRDPDRYSDMHRRKLAAFHEQVLTVPDERERLHLLTRTVVVNGFRSRIEALSALAPPMRAYADGLTESDRAPIVAMTAAWQGAEQAELAAYWMRCRPEAFRVFRTAAGELCGYAACLDLTEADVGVDPAVDAMWRYASKLGPPRSGERVRAWRFFLDREQGQRPSPSLTLFVACQMLDIMQLADDTAWSFVAAFEDAVLWTPALEYLDFWAATEADFTVGGSRFPVFAHDWRRAGIAEWTQVTHARQLGATVRPAVESLEEPVLSRSEFTDAVRAALRQLRTPDLLRANPLVRSRMVRRNTRDGRTHVDTLREMVEAGIGALGSDAGELMSRTFLRPTSTQERVAAALHLSFNTYRRHRDRATADLAAALWDHETGRVNQGRQWRFTNT
ncbi:ATP-binding protein [Actinoplanes sp. NBRC 103695]|uniref:ATP-binding protein n=1 Tax=Actinoplanes sp. NBRC 103695 TaxID=3032202 RepID=UPI0024A17E04|nr:ATP-binding protein [Actinoplanes sp. NBRC 103695]GLZ02242.1 hypothetical protein Acsp02_94930 [Actinoplanes sp. NBRC 103695]